MKLKFNEIERLLVLLKEAVNSDKTSNSDKALYLLLEQYQDRLPELDDRFHKSFRQTNVTKNDDIDKAIHSLLYTSAIFWNIFEQVQQEKRLNDGQ